MFLGFGAKGAEGGPKPQMFNKGFGAKGAEGGPKPQMFNKGFGAKGAEGGPKPQMFNKGFGAKGAEGGPKPQNVQPGYRRWESNPQARGRRILNPLRLPFRHFGSIRERPETSALADQFAM